jgi:hypothetical protein
MARATYHNFLRVETLSLTQRIDNDIDNELYIETSNWWIGFYWVAHSNEGNRSQHNVPGVDSLASNLQLAILQQMFEGVP